MCCADDSRGTRWDGQKNEVITFSRDAKINTAGSTSRQLVNLAFKNKKESCNVTTQLSLYSNLKVMPNLKEKYMTAFSHTLIQNSITQSKGSRSIKPQTQMTATFHTYGRLFTHTVCTFKMMYCTMHAAALQQL